MNNSESLSHAGLRTMQDIDQLVDYYRAAMIGELDPSILWLLFNEINSLDMEYLSLFRGVYI